MENTTTKHCFKDVLYDICVVIALIFLCIMLWLCFNNAIWCDEVFSLNMSKNSYLDNIAYTATDVHPPMYYLILKFFMDTFTTVFYMISPVYFMKLTTWIGLAIIFYFSVFKLSKELPKTVVGIFLVSMFGFECLTDLSIFARMYSYAALFVLVETYFAIKVVRYGGTKNWAMLVLFFELAAYTHNFALVASVGILFYMLLYYLKNNRSQIRNLYICGLFCLTFYFPWLMVLMVQYFAVSLGFWIENFTIDTIIGFFKYIFMFDALSGLPNRTQNILMTALVIYHLILAMVVAFRKKRTTECIDPKYARGGVLVGLCSMFFMFAAGTAVSLIVRPILTARYFSIVFPTALLSVIMLHYFVICEYILPKLKARAAKKPSSKKALRVLSGCLAGAVAVLGSAFSLFEVIKVFKKEQGYQNNYIAETQLYEAHKNAIYIFDEPNIDQVYFYTYHMNAYVIGKEDERFTGFDRVAGEQERPNIDWTGIKKLLEQGNEVIYVGNIAKNSPPSDEKIKITPIALFEHEDFLDYNWYILSME